MQKKMRTTALWLLCRRAVDIDHRPDQTGAVIVRASSGPQARKIACGGVHEATGAKVWLDSKKTTCSRLTADGATKVLLDMSRARA